MIYYKELSCHLTILIGIYFKFLLFFMGKFKRHFFLLIMFTIGFYGCTTKVVTSDSHLKAPEILTIYNDGSIKYKGRFVNKNDVVIYPDGFGGERAAVKVRVPLHPDFYRDTIHVRRVDSEVEI